MEYKDYYEVMGVARDASQGEIKRTYRKLARKYHPDVSKEADAEERFKSLGEAYEVLKDPEKRAAYDQLGANWQGGQDFNAPPDWDAGFEFSGGGFAGANSTNYSDFFEELFGQRPASQGGAGRGGYHARGQDRHAKILVDLEDSFKGATRAINLQVPELTPDGHLTTRTRTLNIKIPKGIREGQKVRLSGQGDPGHEQAAAGDLYLEIDFKPHPLYRAKAHDLYLDLPVTPWEAALGATVKVPTPKGVVDLKVPAGSVQGRKMRLKGRGIPAKQAGDLYVVLQIALPEAKTEQAKKLYKQMQDDLDFNPRSHLGVEA
jgi:curved DNA-binding protein